MDFHTPSPVALARSNDWVICTPKPVHGPDVVVQMCSIHEFIKAGYFVNVLVCVANVACLCLAVLLDPVGMLRFINLTNCMSLLF